MRSLRVLCSDAALGEHRQYEELVTALDLHVMHIPIRRSGNDGACRVASCAVYSRLFPCSAQPDRVHRHLPCCKTIRCMQGPAVPATPQNTVWMHLVDGWLDAADGVLQGLLGSLCNCLRGCLHEGTRGGDIRERYEQWWGCMTCHVAAGWVVMLQVRWTPDAQLHACRRWQRGHAPRLL